MQKLILSALLALSLQISFAQTHMTTQYTKYWKTVDNYLNKGLTKSAQTEIEKILILAKSKGDPDETIKALCMLRVSMRDRDEESRKNDIGLFEKELKTASFPVKQLLHSMLADLYWTYYEENRYKILNRTTIDKVSENDQNANITSPVDIETWSADDFYNKTYAHYNASLAEKEKSKYYSITNIAEIIEKGKNTSKLRPSLYDFLAHRAIDYFKQEENELTKPAYSFEISDEKAFAVASTFCNATFKTSDTNSKKYTALKLYQEIIKVHLNDEDPSALIDADIARIQFVHNKTTLPQKNELYRKALQSIAETYPNNNQAAMASFLLAETYAQGSYSYDRRGSMNSQLDEKKVDYVKAKTLCEAIIEKHRNTEAGARAQQLLQQILSQSLSITNEKVVLPNVPSLAYIEYKNISKLYCKIVKVTNDEMRERNYNYVQDFQRHMDKPAEREWTVELPNKDDYKQHSTEIKIEALPLGAYAILISESPKFEKETSTALSYIQVSKLAYVVNQSNDGSLPSIYVVNRESGEPQPNVTLKLWYAEYNYKKNQYEFKLANTYISDANGMVKTKFDTRNSAFAVELIQGKDDLYMNDQVAVYEYNNPKQNDRIREFLFTDRSIYRPNQTIYFKGIMIKTDADNPNKHEVIKNQRTHVTLKDVNHQQVATMELTTNEFGSYHGEFKAPEGLLTGQFHIVSDYGSTYISIEEYKRPKFEVRFDTLHDSYKLNETIHVKGFAKAYAGNNIDSATVKYRVFRNAKFPYYWCYYSWGMPSSPQMEITHGIATTNNDGQFEFDFKAIADESVDKNAMPVFDYQVIADVTDLNGETRTGQTHISVSYQSLVVKIEAEEKMNINDFNAVKIFTTNLNGAHLEKKVTLILKKLKSPDRTYRSRLWGKAEIKSIPEDEFRRTFPLDDYNDDNNHLNWDVEKVAWSKTFTSTTEGLEYLQKTGSGNGWYVLEASAKDKYNNEVTDKKFIRLIENNESLRNEHLLIVRNKSTFEPGEKAEVRIVTPYETVFALCDYRKQTPIARLDGKQSGFASGQAIEWIKISEKHGFNFDITEADRGGLYTNGWFVKNNRYYTFNEFMDVPFTNKELSISTETFRDKIAPGSEQEWKLKISGSKKDLVSAELLTTLYDASLDAFQPHAWNKLGLYQRHFRYANWNPYHSFAVEGGIQIYNKPYKEITYFEKVYGQLNWFGLKYGGAYYTMDGIRPRSGGKRVEYKEAATIAVTDDMPAMAAAAPNEGSQALSKNVNAAADATKNIQDSMTMNSLATGETNSIPLRTNFQETAFFFPQLQTDKEGNIILKFKAPDALTRWKLMAYAHTPDMKEGVLTKTTSTQKELMIVPNTPRFFRQGDKMVYTAKVTNMSDQDINNGYAQLRILDAFTEKRLDAAFSNVEPTLPFKAKKGESVSVTWDIEIPTSMTTPVIVQTFASNASQEEKLQFEKEAFYDGEQNLIPVIPNSMLVTETLPLPMKPNTTKNFKFENLLNSNKSNTLKHYNLTVEYTANPAWYAIQALPYLTDYPYECAEQTFNRYYANAIATHIANSNPKIKEIFSSWSEKDTAALLSNLEKNQELKSALLQETPWVLEAKTESEQKRNIATLFNLNRMSRELERTLRELEIMQTPNGGFTWFKGMPEDRFMTQYILTGIGRLKHIEISEVGSERRIQQIIQKAIPYLDQKIKEDYENLKKYKADLNKQQISTFQIQYLYMRSFFMDIPVQAQHKTAFDYYLKQCGKYWLPNGKMMQAMSALALHRWNDKANAQAIVKSLRENAIHNEEMGMYYRDVVQSYWWHEAPIESQAILIECFKEVAMSEKEVDELKIWLLKSKQTTNWKTTKATADACYALLLNGTYWLAADPHVEIKIGGMQMNLREEEREAGTGYTKVSINADLIKAERGNIEVSVKSDKAIGTTWGAVYWQYFEELDKIPSSETGLKLKKQLYKVSNADKGEILTPITNNSPLHVGDKVKVRIELRVDRPIEYVHMKDMRGACFEPINVLSNYKYQGGLGYYESTKDLATNFFFHYLQKGTYVFEYPMFVTYKGEYSNGIATIQCMYAPEFSSHSEGIRVNVK